MRILALDTATESCSVALLIEGRSIAQEIELERGHAERILLMIDAVLAEAGVKLAGLDAIAFGRGPGSFTGVRLAASVTQGLAFGAGLGVVPVSDLQAVAQRALELSSTMSRVLVCNDARMGEVYWACYERGLDGLASAVGEERVGKPASVVLPSGWSSGLSSESSIYAVGRGFMAHPELRSIVSGGSAGVYEPLLPRALEIALLAAPEVAKGRLAGPEAALPVYLRDDVARVAQPKSLN